MRQPISDRFWWLFLRRYRMARQVPGFHAGRRTYACRDSTMAEHVQLLNCAWIWRSVIGRYSRVHGRVSECDVGAFCSIAEHAVVGGLGRHPTDQVSSHAAFYASRAHLAPQAPLAASERFHSAVSRTRIGNDVWIAYQATVLNGVTIGDGAVVATGSIVTRDVPPYAIVAGVPAKVIRFRFADEALREALIASRWWEWPEPALRLIAEAFTQDEPLSLVRWQALQARARALPGVR
jgi:acetyltransferase-like isoleucine patch superfamily enzyme